MTNNYIEALNLLQDTIETQTTQLADLNLLLKEETIKQVTLISRNRELALRLQDSAKELLLQKKKTSLLQFALASFAAFASFALYLLII